jgi:hypothetical protein
MKRIMYFVLTALFLMVLVTSCETTQEMVISGSLVSHSDCKSGLRVSELTTSDTITRVDYSYDATNKKLSLTHVNAGFNCCPDSLWCNIYTGVNSIIIKESEKESLCNCNCLYDLSIEINGVEKGKYELRFIEPYVPENVQQLYFDVDLEKKPSGSFSIVRNYYPWM